MRLDDAFLCQIQYVDVGQGFPLECHLFHPIEYGPIGRIPVLPFRFPIAVDGIVPVVELVPHPLEVGLDFLQQRLLFLLADEILQHRHIGEEVLAIVLRPLAVQGQVGGNF